METIRLKFIKGKKKGQIVEASLDLENDRAFYNGKDIDWKDVVEVDENGEEIDYNKEVFTLTPKGCLFCALSDTGIIESPLGDHLDNSAYVYLESKFKSNGYITDEEGKTESNDGEKLSPKEIFMDMVEIFYGSEKKRADAAWELFVHSMKLHGNTINHENKN